MSTAADRQARPPAADFCPYVGLAPFEKSHADYYFGRDLDAANLADNVLAAPITVLYGASGVGKTSVLNVGLPKALQRLGLEATLVMFRHWQGDTFRSSLLQAIAAAADIEDAGADTPLVQFAARIIERTGKPLVLFLDQFEEYFVYQDGARARTFEQELDALVKDANVEAQLLIAIREDGYHLLDRLRTRVTGVLDNSLELAHLDDDAVREAITGPIEVYNERYRDGAQPIAIERPFVEMLLAQLKQRENGAGKGTLGTVEEPRIELPYLQLALTKIWQAAGGAHAERLSAEILRERSVRQIARDHLDQVMGRLDSEDQALCARIFDRVVTPSGAKIAMVAADLAEYAGAGDEVARVERILDGLSTTESRVFTPVPRPDGRRAYQIFHDVLGRPILE